MRECLEVVGVLEEMTIQERVKFFAAPDTFFIFWIYYFPMGFDTDLAYFHFVWMYYLTMTDLNIMNEAFRGSLKTEMIKVYLVKCMCYKNYNFIVNQSFDSDSSESTLVNVARMLNTRAIVHDYGLVYPFNTKKAEFAKKSIKNFDTTTGVKIKAKGLRESIRGDNVFDEDDGTARPDLLLLDDIDTTDMVSSKDLIDKYERKLKEETIGAMSKKGARILFNGNTISVDGIVRRFAERAKVDKNWIYFRQPIYDQFGKIAWDYFTQEMIDDIKSKEFDSWDQNYELIPLLTVGNPVFDAKKIKREIVRPYDVIEGFELYQHPQDDLSIGIDVAEGGDKGDYTVIKARNKKGESVFECELQATETITAQKLNWILTDYSEIVDGVKRQYLGTIMIENNMGRALINECKKTKDDGTLVYPWFQYVLKERKLDGTFTEDTIERFGFRTSEASRDLIIREYRNSLYDGSIDVTQTTYNQILTFIWNKNNKAEASGTNHDDRIIADMIAYFSTHHEPMRALYKSIPVDENSMNKVELHLHRLRTGYYRDEEY